MFKNALLARAKAGIKPAEPGRAAPEVEDKLPVPGNPPSDKQELLVAEILESTSDGVFLLGFDWRFNYLNSTASLLISTGQDLVGCNLWEAFPAATNLEFWHNYRRTMYERCPTEFTAYYPEPLKCWFEVRAYPTTKGICVFFRDITKRRAEEERLRLLEQAVASSPVGITVAKFTGTDDCPLIYVNPAFEDLTGYSSDEALGTDCRFLMGSDLQQNGRLELNAAIREGRPTKALVRNYKKDGRRFFNEVHLSQVYDQEGRISHIVGIQNDVTEQLETRAKLARQAQYDALTGLANRYLLLDRLREALASAVTENAQIAVVILDLDNFKYLNDRLGHMEADRLLVQIASRLNAVVEPEDTVARFGGDEFAIIYRNWRDQGRLHKKMEKLLQEIRRPMECGAQELVITGSVGVAIFPQDSVDAEELLQMADLSMFSIKRCGKNSFRFYSSELRFNNNEPLDVAVGLQRALLNREFKLHYQPRVDARTRRIKGFEALIRWQHPERGLLPPSNFIRIAEDTGLINEIGRWVIEEALRQNAEWIAEGFEPVSMSVNVSPAQIRDPQFPNLVARLLADAGLAPESLELELTESLLIDNADVADASLRALKALGVLVAIDDFGTGYAGFNYLSRFPIDTIKIDHFFTHNIATRKTAATICRSVIKLGQSLGLKTVAEGVETKEQVALLRRWGCGELQGFLFAKPLPGDDAKQALKRYRGRHSG